MNLTPDSKIYFIGIGGIAMSAAAGIAKQLQYEVSGSDSRALYDPAKAVLAEEGIEFHLGYDAAHLQALSEDWLFVASAGEDETNPEVAYLRENNKQIFSLSEFLHQIFIEKLRVVVTGTHGKSTTAAILGKALAEIDDSSFMTGAVLQDTNRNFYLGEGHYVVFEGDEYKALYDDPTPKFAQYQPDILMLTNLEFDHPDLFASVEEIKAELRDLISKMPNDAVIVYNADNAALASLVHEANLATVSYALDNPADFTAEELTLEGQGTKFKVQKAGDYPIETYRISSYGRMNVYNSLGPIALLRTLGFSAQQVQSGLNEFLGIKRRFEYIGESKGVKIFDDYAHHPTAVRETLAAARLRFPDAKLWAVFEPHTFSRTAAVLPELAKAFDDADEVLLAEIYPAREQRTAGSITSKEVVAAVAEHQPRARLISDKQVAQQILHTETKPGDVVIIMAVGDFNTLAKQLCKQDAN
ncbi:MAG TPA: UDP-N-acetylmuramate--L-alanine ligase [Candidatus Doudnabacteria bacterium]|nr:UDP-N-acetylmuramate--L-alanine ligase [Candidatus Doudnabacteria bacterium]